MLSLLPLASVALDNGVARTPPMGWMTWERFRCTADGGDVAGGGASQPSCAEDPENCISERLVRQHAEIMARPEWRGAGYEYLNIDDCWENWSRSPGGKLAPNSTRFPHGMRALADYVHSLGLKLGTYNDMGTETCGGYPGECKDESCSLDESYMGVDAATYTGWGIDSLKMDGCHSVHTHGVLDPAYRYMGEALNRTGRPVLYSCSWPDYIRTAKGEAPVNYTETAARCNMWRMYNDIQDSYESVSGIVDWVGDHAEANGMLAAQGPGAWNDPDMLLVGNFGLSLAQAKAQMALWSIMAAPLMMGNDLRRLSEEMKAVLLAREVIAVDQDPLGKQGRRVFQLKGSQCGAHDVWARPLANGDTAVVLWNRGVCGTHSLLGFDWPTVGVADASRRMAVRDLFEQRDLGVHAGSFSGFVDLSGVLMLRLSPAEGAERWGAS